MKLKFGESKFGAPVGTYLAKFAGAAVREAKEGMVGRDGKPMGPGLEWSFEIADGPQKGNIVSRTTGMNPTAGNAAGKLLKQLAGGILDESKEIDVQDYVGRFYQVLVEDNSTGTGTRVGTVMPFAGTPPAASGIDFAKLSAAMDARRAGGPPPRPSRPPEASYYVEKVTGSDPVEMTAGAIVAWLKESKYQPENVAAVKVGESEWKTLAAYGLADPDAIPF